MTDPTTPTPRSPTGRRRRRAGGFTFTEVLFAVMILGIGFIMIAGIFPVSLGQVKLSNEESTAASVARAATTFLQRQAELPNGAADNIFRATIPTPPALTAADPIRLVRGQTWSMYDSRMHPAQPATPTSPQRPAQQDLAWGAVSGNLIFPTDPRYAWVAVYRRDAIYTRLASGAVRESPLPYAQVTIIPVQARNRSQFSNADDIDPVKKGLVAKPVRVTIPGPGGQMTINDPASGGAGNRDAAAEGAYVIISDYTSGNASLQGWMNGRVYRLGLQDPADPHKFDLIPGNDFSKDPGPDGDLNTNGDNVDSLTNVPALIVGKGYAGGDPEGTAMDVSVYTTYIKVN